MSDIGLPFGLEREPIDQRDHWKKGRIRHLRLSTECPPDAVYAIRVCEHDNQVNGTDILYTLVVHPRHADRVEEYRRNLESKVGGLFSPDADWEPQSG